MTSKTGARLPPKRAKGKPSAPKKKSVSRASARGQDPATANRQRAAYATEGGLGQAYGPTIGSITPFLWFDNNFQDAAAFYVSLFPNSAIERVTPMGGSFILSGQRFMALNGGPHYRFSPAVSFFVVCKDQAEVDRLWDALAKEGRPNRCGWIDDKFGLTWQIVPQAFLELTAGPPQKARAVFEAMMGMTKFIVKDLEAAYQRA